MNNVERTIKLNIDLDKMEDVNPISFQQAIGRQSTWNMQSWDIVVIRNDGNDGDMVAVYSMRCNPNVVGYVIGAIYNRVEETYSYHS